MANWIKMAVKHKGRCKNMGSAACPKGSPQYNLAERFKHGDLHHPAKKKKSKRLIPKRNSGGYYPHYGED